MKSQPLPGVQIPYGFNLSATLALALFTAASMTARAAVKAGKGAIAPRRKRGLTLRPGSGTPVWNELIARAQPLLAKRGSKAQLARILGLPRQRLHDVLNVRRASLDAERTLVLLCWVAAREQGSDLMT